MPNFAILRVQKLKHINSINRSLKHAFREQNTPNADPDKLEENKHGGAQNAQEALQKIQAKLPEKR